jgi:dihydrofolate reductase
MMFTLGAIYACDQKDGIGLQGRLPWKSPADIAYFWETIGETTVIVGATTWKGASKFFLKRPSRQKSLHVVVSHEKDGYEVHGDAVVRFVRSPSKAIEVAKKNGEAAWVCGGKSLYNAFADDVHVWSGTRIYADYTCDTYLDWSRPPNTNFWDMKSLDHYAGYPDCAACLYVKKDEPFVDSRLTALGLLETPEWR